MEELYRGIYFPGWHNTHNLLVVQLNAESSTTSTLQISKGTMYVYSNGKAHMCNSRSTQISRQINRLCH